MAETAGLVIGSVALTTVFDSAMNAFAYIEAGATYGETYNHCALNEKLLRLRLARWEESVRTATHTSGFSFLGSVKDGETAKRLLGEIVATIETAETVGERYEPKAIADEPSSQDTTIDNLISRVKNMAMRRQKNASLTSKARWALRDATRYKNLINQLRQSIKDLEDLFPAEQFPMVSNTQINLANDQADELVNASQLKEPGDDEANTAALLQEAAIEIEDPVLKAAAERINKAVQTAKTGHHIEGVSTFHNSQFLGGDTIAPGMESQAGTGASHTMGDIETWGNSQTQCGNRYGGVEFFSHKRGLGEKAQDQDDAKGEERDDEADLDQGE